MFGGFEKALRRNALKKLPKEEQEKQIAIEANKEADPTTYSAIAPKEPLAKIGEAKSAAAVMFGRDESYSVLKAPSGEIYTSLEGKDSAATEQIVARMLKGAINVADVVTLPDGTYASRNMPLKSIENKVKTPELEADVFILRYLMGDSDHIIRSGRNIDSAKGRHVYYDFGFAKKGFFNSSDEEKGVDETDWSFCDRSNVVTAIIREKAHLLSERFAGEQGKEFLKVLFGTSGKAPDELFWYRGGEGASAEHHLNLFHNLLMKRLEALCVLEDAKPTTR